MLELEERVGRVEIGYQDVVLNAIPDQKYQKNNEDESEHCCICCDPFTTNDSVFTTECLHIHHR